MGLSQRKTSGKLNGGSKMVVVGQGIFSEKKSVPNSEKQTYILDGKPGELIPCTFEQGKIDPIFNFSKNDTNTGFNVFAEYNPFYLKNTIVAQYQENGFKISQFDINGNVSTEYGFNTPLQLDNGADGIITDLYNRFILYGLSLLVNNKNFICKINSNGTVYTNFTSPFDGTVNHKNFLVRTDKYGYLYVIGISNPDPTGASLKYTGPSRNFIYSQFMKLNSNGSINEDFNIVETTRTFNSNFFNPKSTANIRGIKFDSRDKIYIYGSFTSYSGHSSGNIIRLNSNGYPDTTFNQANYINGTIYDIAIINDNKLILCGEISAWKAFSTNNIIKLDEGVFDEEFSDNLPKDYFRDKIIRSVEIDTNGKILVGGDFGFIRLNIDGTLDTSFEVNILSQSIVNKFTKSLNKGYFVGGVLNKTQSLQPINNIIKLKGC